jgi:DNA replication protein DnaC
MFESVTKSAVSKGIKPTAKHMDAAKAYYTAWMEDNDTKPPLAVLQNHHFSRSPRVRESQILIVAKCLAMNENRGVITPSMSDEEKSYIELYEREDRQKKALIALRVGSLYQHARTSSGLVKDTEYIRAVNDFQASGKTFCLLLGTTGSGKTFAAVTAMAEVMYPRSFNAGYRATSTHEEWNGMMVKHGQLSGMLGVDGKKQRDALFNIDHLLIDDLRYGGEGMVTPAFVTAIDELIDHRLDHQLKTIITSNANKDEFIKTYGERVWSRLKSSGLVYSSNSEDLRLSPPNG